MIPLIGEEVGSAYVVDPDQLNLGWRGTSASDVLQTLDRSRLGDVIQMSDGKTLDPFGRPIVPRDQYLTAPDGPAKNTLGRVTAPVTAASKGPMGRAGQFLLGKDPATQRLVKKELFDLLATVPGVGKKAAARMAGSKIAALGGRLVPGLSVAGNVMDVADLVTGQESFANKAMDAGAMTLGGIIGSVGGPLGTSVGISTGKMLSDGAQWLFGDKKTPEERKMEEALLALRMGGLA